MNKYLVALLFISLLIPTTIMPFDWNNPDFGTDGLKGLTELQIKDLADGKTVFSTTDQSKDSSLIESALIFNKPIDEVWVMLSKTEEQIKYIKEVDKLKVIERNDNVDTMWFQLKLAFIPIRYQIHHHYNREAYYFYWELDPAYKSDLNNLKGFWKFYPYGNSKTLARYGSLVSLKYVPSWLQDRFKKTGVEKALKAVKCYVDSGGTCKRKGY